MPRHVHSIELTLTGRGQPLPILMSKRKPYDEILKDHPEFEGVISKKYWDFIGQSDEGTVDFLVKDWIANLERNINSKRFKRHGGLDKDCIGLGKNKALVGIGAGASLNKNKHVLKWIHDIDGVKPPDERDFIFVASNHMLKPLLNDGIIPDFVMVADASDVVFEQLTQDIPESGRNCVLLAGLHCSPKVLKKWEKQGRDIRFYLTGSPGIPERYKELTGKNPQALQIQQGGNVLNSCWSIGLKFFGSSVFMALGNDLSYELKPDIDEQRNSYYADGDYSTNLGTKRDEAKRSEEWLGFSLAETNIISMDAVKRYDIELNPVGTTGTLWVYKTWLEANVLASAKSNIKYTYYNCSEGGIAGVLCSDDTLEGREDINNWFLMDQKCRKWRTRMFKDAIAEFLQAKRSLQSPGFGVPNATGLVARI